jgi:membrane-associated protease RseP (regulator of RpoE activity)
MDPRKADRKVLFDIGLSGPWAGLFVAIPISVWGIMTAPAAPLDAQPTMIFQDPLLFQILMKFLRPELLPGQELYMNPLLMAGWVGMLITGLNMLPIGQLDGGHTSFALFGRRADWLSRAVMIAGGVHMLFSGNFGWLLMMLIVWKLGIYHEPTANDHAELGWPRKVIGFASLAIPIFCFTPTPFG